MKTYPSALADTIEPLEKKGMRFDEGSLDNGDIRHLDNNIVVFRGNAAKLLDRAFHGIPGGVTGKQIRQCNLRLGSRYHASPCLSSRLLEHLFVLDHVLHSFERIWHCHSIGDRSLPSN